MLRHAKHRIVFKHLSSNSALPQNTARRVLLFFSTLPKTRGSRSRRRKKKNMLKPMSEILTSPKLQNDVTNRIVKLQESAKSKLIPTFLQNRPPPKGHKTLVMDRNWWFYNICLACVPGLFIAIICESQQGQMKSFYDDQRLMNLRRIYGDDYIPPTPSSPRPEDSGRVIKLYNSIMALLGLVSEKKSESDIFLIRNKGEENEPDSATINSTAAEKLSNAENSLILDIDQENDEPNAATINLTGAAKATEEQTLSDLLCRIQTLEKSIGINPLNDKPLSSEYRLKRLEQSGIQNRVDDRLIDEYKKNANQLHKYDRKGENEARELRNDESSLPVSISEAMRIGMKELMKQKINEFSDNVALVMGYSSDANRAEDDALDYVPVTISNNSRHDVDLEEFKNNGSNDPSIDFKHPTNDIEHDGEIAIETQKPGNVWKAKSWIKNIIRWKKHPAVDSKESTSRDAQPN